MSNTQVVSTRISQDVSPHDVARNNEDLALSQLMDLTIFVVDIHHVDSYLTIISTSIGQS